MNRDCVAAIPKPRKRRTESNVGIDTAPPTGVPFSGVFGGTASISAEPREPSKPTPTKPAVVDRSYSQESLLSRPDIRHNGSKSFTALLTRGLGLDTPYIVSGDLLNGLDYNSVQNSFTVFRQLSTQFPFVYVNPAEDAVLFAAQRPFTTLAIYLVTSGANTLAQTRLIEALRLALSSKAIVEGERSLDLMVGLLIFLAWHQHYLDKPQIYQYLCLLAGMAEDLGLSTVRRVGPEPIMGAGLERDRAFLGCYYLCSGLSSTAFNKTNPMRWTDSLRQCAESVARTGNLPSDQNLVAITELAETLDALNEEVEPDTNLTSPAYNALVEMHTRITSNRFKSLKRDHTFLSSNIAIAAAQIATHQRRLVTNPSNSSALIKCACEISEYIDDVLSRPPITLHQTTIVDWTNLLSILVLMATVSKALPSTGGWEAGAVSSMLSPDAILDKLAAHIANAPRDDALAPRNENLVRWFQVFCAGVKRNVIYGRAGQEQHGHVDSRFNSVNSGAGLPNPYAAQPALAAIEFSKVGVLDEAFLTSFMGPP